MAQTGLLTPELNPVIVPVSSQPKQPEEPINAPFPPGGGGFGFFGDVPPPPPPPLAHDHQHHHLKKHAHSHLQHPASTQRDQPEREPAALNQPENAGTPFVTPPPPLFAGDIFGFFGDPSLAPPPPPPPQGSSAPQNSGGQLAQTQIVEAPFRSEETPAAQNASDAPSTVDSSATQATGVFSYFGDSGAIALAAANPFSTAPQSAATATAATETAATETAPERSEAKANEGPEQGSEALAEVAAMEEKERRRRERKLQREASAKLALSDVNAAIGLGIPTTTKPFSPTTPKGTSLDAASPTDKGARRTSSRENGEKSSSSVSSSKRSSGTSSSNKSGIESRAVANADGNVSVSRQLSRSNSFKFGKDQSYDEPTITVDSLELKTKSNDFRSRKMAAQAPRTILL